VTNNDILRRLRYAFDINDSKMIALFALADVAVSREQISDWLKKDEDPAYKLCSDIQLASFLNGFIHEKRGKKDGPQQEPEKRLNNNIIFRKLRIALSLKDDGILQVLGLVKYAVSKHELSAFFRRPDHRQYRECKDQILRNFLHGLQIEYRPETKYIKIGIETKGEAAKVASADCKSANPEKTASDEAHHKDVKPKFKWKEHAAPSRENIGEKEHGVAKKDESIEAGFKWNTGRLETK